MSITYQQIATLAYRILHERGADEVWTYESPWERDFVVAVHVKGERKEGRLSSLEMDSRDDAARRIFNMIDTLIPPPTPPPAEVTTGGMEISAKAECPVCKTPVAVEGSRKCDKCGAAHHGDCWALFGRCAIFGCRN